MYERDRVGCDGEILEAARGERPAGGVRRAVIQIPEGRAGMTGRPPIHVQEILIANRGEIAPAHHLGCASWHPDGAVYSTADAGSLTVKFADETSASARSQRRFRT